MKNLSLLLLLIVFGGCKKSSRIALENIEAHIEYQDEKGLENVTLEYSNIVAKYPTSPEAHYLYARCIKDSDADQYEPHLRKSIELNPNFCYALLAIAEEYQFSSIENEKYYIERCLQVEPKNANALKHLIIHYYRRTTEESNFDIIKLNYKLLIKYCSQYLALSDVNSTEFYENVLKEKQRATFELNKLTKCEKLAGTYSGNHYVGVGLIKDEMRIGSDCNCVFKGEYNSWSSGLMTNEEFGPLINLIIDTFEMKASGNFNGVAYGDNVGDEYHFSWDTYHITLTSNSSIITMYCWEKEPPLPAYQFDADTGNTNKEQESIEQVNNINETSLNNSDSYASAMTVTVERAYFYKDTLDSTRLRTFCIKGDVVKTEWDIGLWVWASFTNDNHETTGWMKLSDLNMK